MKLSEVPFNEIIPKDQVQSKSGRPGVVVRTDPGARSKDNVVMIEWDNGSVSRFWHEWTDLIEYLGPAVKNEVGNGNKEKMD